MSDYSQQNSVLPAHANPLEVGPGNIVSAQAYHAEQSSDVHEQEQSFVGDGDDGLPVLTVEQDGQQPLSPLQQQNRGEFQGGGTVSPEIMQGNQWGNNAQVQEENTATIYSMPHRGAPAEVYTNLSEPVSPLPSMPLKRSAKKVVLISLVVLVVLGGAGIFAYDALFRNVAPLPQQPPADPLPPVDNPPQGTLSPGGIDTVKIPKNEENKIEKNLVLENKLGETIGRARVVIDRAEIEVGMEETISLAGVALDDIEETSTLTKKELLLHQSVSGLYTISSPKLEFEKPIEITIGFNADIIAALPEVEVQNLRIGFIEQDAPQSEAGESTKAVKWYLYSSSKLNETSDALTVTVSKLHEAYYAVISYDANERVDAAFSARKIVPVSVDFPLGTDADSDGLTDEEEKIFDTNAQLVDTDGDRHDDFTEIFGLYDPTKGGGAQLLDNKFFNTYRNVQYGYTVLYPATWLVRSLDSQSTKEIIFTSPSSEFFGILAETNPVYLTSTQWYLLHSGLSGDEEVKKARAGVEEMKIHNGLTVSLSPDRFRAYLAYKDQMFTLTYNTVNAKELNFKAIFRFMLENFEIINFDTTSAARGKTIPEGQEKKETQEDIPALPPEKTPEPLPLPLISKEAFVSSEDLKTAGIDAEKFSGDLSHGNYSIRGTPVQVYKGTAPDILDMMVDVESDTARSSSLLFQNTQSLMKILAASVNEVQVDSVASAPVAMGDEAVMITLGNAAIGSGTAPAQTKVLVVRYKEAVFSIQYIESIEAEALALAKALLPKIDAFRNQQSAASQS